MRYRCCANRRTEGFVLLYTLWLLLGGVALLAVVSSLAIGRARGAAASIEWLRSTSAAESAAHDAMFRLAVGGKKALTAGASRQMVIDGMNTQTEIIHSDGLVDLNTAGNATLGKVLTTLLGADHQRALHAIGNLGTLHSYAQLGSAEGMGAAAVACLLPYVTLSSGRGLPAAEFAPARVRLALGLGTDKVSSVATTASSDSMAGNVARIAVEVLAATGSGRHLAVDVLLTGRLDQPARILEWQWSAPGTRAPGSSTCEGRW